MARVKPEPSRERLLERGDLGPLDETPLLLERRDGLLGVGDDARAVAGNRGQHVTLLAICATSRRAWMPATRASSRAIMSRRPAWLIRQ